MYDTIIELRNIIDEATRLHQLNMELLDVLGALLTRMMDYCGKNSIPIDRTTISLIEKAKTLYEEIHSEPVQKSPTDKWTEPG